MTEISTTKWKQAGVWLLGLALPLAIGALIAFAIPQPIIGVIRLDDAIYSYSARDMIAQISYAIERPEVRAVVIALNSPGGTVEDTESVYLELARLRAKKPVIAVVNGMAASGAYYLSVNTDYIYVKPNSLVGNIGVITYLPPAPFIFEDVVSTGPYKLWGGPRDSEMRKVDTIKRGFFQAVKLGRGSKLKAKEDVVLSGQIWTGTEAVEIGIADAIGTERDALEMAARLARVANYQTADLRKLADLPSSFMPFYPFYIQSPEGVTLPYPAKPGTYLLLIPEMPVKK